MDVIEEVLWMRHECGRSQWQIPPSLGCGPQRSTSCCSARRWWVWRAIAGGSGRGTVADEAARAAAWRASGRAAESAGLCGDRPAVEQMHEPDVGAAAV